MLDSIDRVASALLELPIETRAALAAQLIASLDEQDDGDVDGLWLAEARRRLEAVERGVSVPRPAEEVFQRIEAALSAPR